MIHLAGTDFSHLTSDELIKGIQALDLPDYIRSKAYGIDVRETLAQMTEMTIQLGVNMGLSPDDALKWARKLQESVSQSEFDSWVATLLDGGPSIFMNTLSELQTAYPNGASGVALVRETDPAKIYVWTGSAWESFGDYQGIEVRDDSITKEKIFRESVLTTKLDNYINKILDSSILGVKSNNLFDDSSVTPNMYVPSSSGIPKAPSAGGRFNASDFIPVKPSTTYTTTISENIAANQLAFYDENKEYISGLDSYREATFTTPNNAYYTRNTIDGDLMGVYMMNEGSSLLPYETFGAKLDVPNLSDYLRGVLTLVEKLNLVPSPNLFDKSKATLDKYISVGDGVAKTPAISGDFSASDFIRVEPNTEYSATLSETSSANQMAFYDEHKKFIVPLETTRGVTFTSPSNAYYARFTVQTSMLDSFMVNKGSSLLPYEPFGVKLGEDKIQFKTPKEVFAKYLLNGGNAVLLGDSNTAGVGTTGYAQNGPIVGNSNIGASIDSKNWANRLVDTVKSINPECDMRNWGISGWQTKRFLDNGIENYIKPDDSLAIIMLGTNDRIATASSNSSEFKQRLDNIVNYCHSVGVDVILMSSIPASVENDNNLETYSFDTFEVNNVVREVATENNMGYIDNYDWFLKFEEDGNNVSDLYSDHLHMTDFGSYNYLFRNIINELGVSYRREGIDR